jgi:hypothetical protein
VVAFARSWQNLSQSSFARKVAYPDGLSNPAQSEPGAWNWTLMDLIDSSADLLIVLRNESAGPTKIISSKRINLRLE